MTNSLKLVILFLIISFSCSGPTKEQKEALDAKAQLEKDLNMYKDVWSRFFDGDTAKAIHDNHIMDIPYKKNERVFARKGNWVEAFPGRIDHLNHDGTYTVAFDDGDSAEIPIQNIRSM